MILSKLMYFINCKWNNFDVDKLLTDYTKFHMVTDNENIIFHHFLFYIYKNQNFFMLSEMLLYLFYNI